MEEAPISTGYPLPEKGESSGKSRITGRRMRDREVRQSVLTPLEASQNEDSKSKLRVFMCKPY